ncbi:MAG: tetratricopeptide repeat protein [Opitutales bacterium]
MKPVRAPDLDSTLPPGADAEERFNEFWRTNGTSVFSSIAIGAVIVVGAQAWRYVQQRIENNTQQAYLAAGTPEEMAAFAQDNADHSLAGAAYIEMANGEYARAEYTQAAEHYALAKDKLAGSVFAERAQLGMAMCEMLSGKEETGVADLRAVMDNPLFLAITRAEAAYNLSLHYFKTKDFKALEQVVDIADSFKDGNNYAKATSGMRYRIPTGD